MTEPTSYARRFVRSAWLLLGFQLIAAAIAIGVTGWAAFYVADLRAERDALRMELASLTGESIADADQAAIEEIIAEDPAIDEPGDPMATQPDTSRAEDPPARPVATQAPTRPAAQSASVSSVSSATAADTADDPQTRTRNTTYPGGLPGQNRTSSPDIGPTGIPTRPAAPSTQVGPTTPYVRDIVEQVQGRPARDPQCVPTANRPCR